MLNRKEMPKETFSKKGEEGRKTVHAKKSSPHNQIV
jgi:hypothetical protein